MPISNCVVISDLHLGCQLGLCPPEFTLDGGGKYKASKNQKIMWHWWNEFWDEFVPEVDHKEPFIVVVNGDIIDGVHHRAVTQISHNLEDQRKLAKIVLEPIVEKCKGKFYVIRGTPAHGGESGQDEESIARSLGAIQDEQGNSSRFDMWLRLGFGLVHFAHHIGVTGTSHFESSAIHKELTEMFTEAGRWRQKAPDVVCRSHRHRCAYVGIPTANGNGTSFCTAGWQLRTPFTFKTAGGRVTTPQIGGSFIRCGNRDIYARHFVNNVKRSQTVIV